MEIKLIGSEALKIQFARYSRQKETSLVVEADESLPKFNFKTESFFDQSYSDRFGLIFHATLLHQGFYGLDLSYLTWFQTSEPIDADFMESPFLGVNAPAIAFPFLRSFISIMLLNAGYKPAIIPSINFVKLYERQKKKPLK